MDLKAFPRGEDAGLPSAAWPASGHVPAQADDRRRRGWALAGGCEIALAAT